ncbi:MAG: hypothetical protein C4521_11245 [Actinobacteria bacterium]|nr:MAG: hypothetical protein C4521_11245 [Actinomycetota bacterium]
MRLELEERIALRLLLGLVLLLPLAFLPFTIEVFIVPKAVLLWAVTALAGALVLAGDLHRGRVLVPDSFPVRALVGFCLAAAGATIASDVRYVSLLGAFMRREGLLTLLAYALVYVLVVRLIQTRNDVRLALWAFVLPVIPTSVYALAQSFGLELVSEINRSEAAVRAYGAFGNPDLLGVYAALMLPILAAVVIREGGKLRLVAGASIPPLVTALLFSYARSGWVGALFGIGLVIAAASWRPRRVLAAAAVLLLLAAGLIAALGLRTLQPTPAETPFAERAASIARTGEGSAATRLDIWPRTIGLILRRPLLGFGPESFRGRFMPLRGSRLVKLEGTTRWDRPHNSLLYLAAATGLVGLACFVAFALSAISSSFRAAWMRRDRTSLLSLGLAAGCVGALVAECFVLWSPATTPLVFAALGLSSASLESGEKSRREPLRCRVPAVAAVLLSPAIVACLAFQLWAAYASLAGERYADLGRAAVQRGNQSEATRYYSQATRAAFWINDYRWRAARASQREALANRDPAGLESAERILKLGLAVDPYDEQAYVELGRVYRRLAALRADTGILRLSEDSYRAALRLDPYSPEAREELSRLLFAGGRYGEALREAGRALRVKPREAALLYLAGSASEKSGNSRLAQAYFRRALRVDPDFAPARAALDVLGR